MKTVSGLIAILILTAVTVPASRAIILVNSDSVVSTGGKASLTRSFDAGAADKIIVSVSAEGTGGPKNISSIRYNGVDLDPAIEGFFTGSGQYSGIYYLDNPFTGGAANVVITFDGNVNGMGVGIASISGTAADFGATASSEAGNVTINTTTAGSFVMASFVNNGGSTGVSPPLNELYAAADIGSAGGAAGYVNNVAVGSPNYVLHSTGGSRPFSVAAEFTVPEPSTLTLALFGLLALTRRKR